MQTSDGVNLRIWGAQAQLGTGRLGEYWSQKKRPAAVQACRAKAAPHEMRLPRVASSCRGGAGRRRACSASSLMLEPAASATTLYLSGNSAQMSSVWVPIEPVEPMRLMGFGPLRFAMCSGTTARPAQAGGTFAAALAEARPTRCGRRQRRLSCAAAERGRAVPRAAGLDSIVSVQAARLCLSKKKVLP